MSLIVLVCVENDVADYFVQAGGHFALHWHRHIAFHKKCSSLSDRSPHLRFTVFQLECVALMRMRFDGISSTL